MDSKASPAYPFGYGLSYTTFQYGKPKAEESCLTLADLEAGRKFKIFVSIANTGNYDGKEVAQLYIRDRMASMMRPIRELKAYKKLLIRQGETAEVVFEIGYNELGFYTEQGEYTVEKGVFDLYIGENCLTENGIVIQVC